MSYITRWLYSTSHKDIAILYLGYGLISSMVATAMSVIIRMELSGPNPQYLQGNNQVFNVMVTGHAIGMIFLFVMPVLIGAFLRRGQFVFNRFIIIFIMINLFSLCDLIMLLTLLHEGLNTEGLSNEVVLEGCVKGQNFLIFGYGLSSLGLALVVMLSLMKVNLYNKIGSAITKFSKNKIKLRDQLTVRDINECIYSEITNRVNTETGEDLTITQDTIEKLYLKENVIKHGNSGKGKLLNFIMNIVKILWVKLKETIIYLNGYLNIIISIVSDVLLSSYKQDNNSIHGGKISKEANALGNAKDTDKYNRNRRIIRNQPIYVQIGEKLNLSCLNKVSRIPPLRGGIPPLCGGINVRYYSTIKEESKLSIAEIKRLLIDNNVLNWPDNKVLGLIYSEVFKKQMNLVKLANVYGINSEIVHKEQLILSESLFFRIIAIDKLARSGGSKTPGIDKISFCSRKEDIGNYLTLVEWLREVIINPNDYNASPIRRVWIPKSNGKMRPLGIPTLKDRALQHLINLILEPLVESTGELHSYGFRPNRSAKNAIAYLRAQLRTLDEDKIINNAKQTNVENKLYKQLSEDKWILDADIKGFFDNINHNWLLNNLFIHPNLKNIIKSWLKSGVIENNNFTDTEMGTPQGGIISPTLANLTLNGLEKVIMESIKPLTTSKEMRIPVIMKDGTKTRIASGLAYVRYADDFVVLARSKHIMNTYIIPAIQEFLKPRGLSLSEEKTKLFRLKDEGTQLDFLGYTFKYQDKWRYDKHMFYTQHAGSRGIALYPNKTKVLAFIDKIRHIFKKSQNLDSYNLIAILNPIIRGWSNYYNLGNSSHYRDTVRNALYHLVWKWAHSKHKRWGKKRIANFYFLTHKESEEVTKNRKVEYTMIKNVKWVFHGFTNEDSRYGGKLKSRYLIDVGNSSQLLSTKHYIIPKSLLDVHAYHPDYMKIIQFNTNVNFKAMGLNSSFKTRLLSAQNNLCTHCGNSLLTSTGLYEGLHIHHIMPIYKGGKRNDISNMVLLHSWCHYDIDHKNESVVIKTEV